MARKQRAMNAKQRELNDSWERLKKDQSKPLLDRTKFGRTEVSKSRPERAIDGLKKFANVNRERVIIAVRPDWSTSVVHTQIEGIEPRMNREEYARREKAAREVKHCVMPLHKGGYILVTDEEMVKQMGKKTA